MRKFSFKKGSFNTLFTLISDPDEFFKAVENKLDAIKVAQKSFRTENKWIWQLLIAKD